MDYRLHIARVTVRAREYMNEFEPNDFEKLHTIEADTEEEAEDKIKAHYDAKSSDYGTSFAVTSIEFFEHIS